MKCKLCNDTGEQRYWEARWRDEKAENEQLRAHLLNLYEDCRGGRASNQSMRKARQMLGLNHQNNGGTK